MFTAGSPNVACCRNRRPKESSQGEDRDNEQDAHRPPLRITKLLGFERRTEPSGTRLLDRMKELCGGCPGLLRIGSACLGSSFYKHFIFEGAWYILWKHL